MFPINRKAAYGVWCALVLGVPGQSAELNSGDRLEAENTARLREFEKNNDRGSPRRPISPELNAVSSSVVENLGAEDLAKMTLDDPVLKAAYVSVLMGSLEQMEPPQVLALADMRRRGKAVTPMLLKLISENQENNVEFAILGKVDALGTVSIEPFLEYARTLLLERTTTMSGEAAGVASYIVGRHGTKEDEALLESVLKERPYVASDLAKALKNLSARLAPRPETRPERREISSTSPSGDTRSAGSTKDHPQDKSSATSRAKSWFVGGIILVFLLGLYRFVRLKLRGPSS